MQWLSPFALGLATQCALLFFSFSCAKALDTTNILPVASSLDINQAATFLAKDFSLLPEKQVAKSNNVYAFYAQPTMKYNHNILGDSIEAEKLVVLRGGKTYTHSVSEQYVFEDIKPRLFDVDNDGEMEVITIRTHVKKGAGIVIYKIVNSELTEFAWVEEIGRSHRWLNIVAVYDLDSDGGVELAWIETPHIGGVLKVARIEAGTLEPLSALPNYSNHSIGERNLCLSVVTKKESGTTVYVPTQNRHEIVGFTFTGESLQKTESISKSVDFSHPLISQYNFYNVIQGPGFCSAP